MSKECVYRMKLVAISLLIHSYIDSCGLGGEISSTFAKLINMKILYASDNPFSGKIPSIIGNWRKLTSLQVWQTFNLLQFMKADLHG
ncbi:hypothetical protein Pyn_25771 [Prunus yedoensis var. nudiflora]|uniref:LRR receptor-like serine/threonine-protein kinase n=1 Tax=Prunus yedoensis var. nudiflora TaxID=2094558 RepID=A0A315B4X8_PRUYE|nr:hypothetical protein Pyn_25771 [Prunus yedoensis var. nudiflora]